MKTVGEVSELARVTVRTLHHYDELGLLSPSERSEAGYRLYSYDDLARLQEILILRALGFPLAEIASLLDDPDHDRLGALVRQRELVGREMNRLGALAAAVDAARGRRDVHRRRAVHEHVRARGARARAVFSRRDRVGRRRRRALGGQSVIRMWPGWTATRSSHAVIAG